MKPASPYDVVMPISRTATFYSAKKRERKALLDYFEHLARNPFTESEWVVKDECTLESMTSDPVADIHFDQSIV